MRTSLRLSSVALIFSTLIPPSLVFWFIPCFIFFCRLHSRCLCISNDSYQQFHAFAIAVKIRNYRKWTFILSTACWPSFSCLFAHAPTFDAFPDSNLCCSPKRKVGCVIFFTDAVVLRHVKLPLFPIFRRAKTRSLLSPGFAGIFYKFSIIGTRLHIPVAISCALMAFYIMFLRWWSSSSLKWENWQYRISPSVIQKKLDINRTIVGSNVR